MTAPFLPDQSFTGKPLGHTLGHHSQRLEAPSMDGTRRKPISNEVVAAYSHCPRKAFLLHCTEERGTPHEYLEMLEECTNVSRSRYWALLRETSAPIRSYGDDAISSRINVLTEANLRAGDLEAYCDALTKVGTRRGRSNSAAYEPTIVAGVQREHILRLSFAGYVLGQVQGTNSRRGTSCNCRRRASPNQPSA